MLDLFATFVAENAAHVIELIGVTIIGIGAAATLILFLYRVQTKTNLLTAYGAFRSSFGRSILLGLEFLIAADIIDTLMKPTTQDLIILGAIVAIRTVISYSLNSELSHESSHSEKAATP